MKSFTHFTFSLFTSLSLALATPVALAGTATIPSAAASSPSATPLFYLQVTNGTRAGQFLTSPKTIGGSDVGLVTWTSSLSNATVWTYFQYPDNYGTIFAGVRTLKRPDHDVVFDSDLDPSLISIIGPSTIQSEWPVSIKLTGWDHGAPVGSVVLADPQLTQYKQWDGCGVGNAKGLAVSSSVGGTCLESLQFIRVSSCKS
ncbi:MAG: hypothetical protein GOMPHAMPRED_007681 [Gomphillus americanus]|uniref:Uncharacterized protein n=1 Tax=Gomphillus americanus TaxID=1940652 RepID=A0A8H3EYD3_9LECA|nr:MAG: hypothetical protein GOMPHAMPRED_007681 [Gomphillus americanus]